MPLTLEQFGLDKVSADAKWELIFLLEDSIDAETAAYVETPEHLAELARRVADAEANPGLGIPMEVVMERLRAKREGRA